MDITYDLHHLKENNPVKMFNEQNSDLKITTIVDNNTDHGSNDSQIANSVKFVYGNVDMITMNPEKINTSFNSIVNELIPYPSSCISTIIEKVNSGDIRYMKEQYQHQIRESLIRPRKHKTLFKQTSQSTLSKSSHDNMEEFDQINHTSSHHQNQDYICFDKFDISRIVKRLREKTNSSTQTDSSEKCNQYAQVNIQGNFGNETMIRTIEQHRSNQLLKNQIQQLSYIIEEMSKERSNHNIYLHQLQKQISTKELKIKEINAEREKLISSRDELKLIVKNSETVVTTYQEEIATTRAENELLKQKLNKITMTKPEEIDNLMNQKDTIINDLNNHLKTYQQENIRLNNERCFLLERLRSPKVAIATNDNKMQEKKFFILEKKIIKDFCSVLNKRLKTIKYNCIQLREQMNILKMEYKNSLNNMIMKENYPEKLEELYKLSFINNFQYCEQQIKSEIIKLKKLNEQLLQEKLHEKDRNIQLNCEFQSCMSHLRNENEHLKKTNISLEKLIQSLRNDIDKLQQEYAEHNLNKQLNQCHDTIKQLQDKFIDQEKILKNNVSIESQLSQLKQENIELKELLAKLKENSYVLKAKYEQSLKLNDQYQVYLECMNNEIQKLIKQIQTDSFQIQTKEQYFNEKELSKQEINVKMQEIMNLQTNLQFFMEKTKAQFNDSDELFKGKTIPQGNDNDIKHIVSQKDLLISEQSSKLNELTTEIGDLCREKIEYENKINLSLQLIQEKDIQIQHLNTVIQSNQYNPEQNDLKQRVSILESELSKEKEKSKELGISLIKEKHLNFITEDLVEKKKHTEKNVEDHWIDEEKMQKTGGDIQKLKQELIIRIGQLRKLIAIDVAQHQSDQTYNSQPDICLMNESLSPVSSNTLTDEFLIQTVLDQSEETKHLNIRQQKPLTKIHSSVEDLRQEFNNLKMTFLQAYNIEQ